LTLTCFKKTFACALLLAAIAGCTSTRVRMSERDIDFTAVQKIENGNTSKEEIISAFGAPLAITVNSKGLETYVFVSGETQNQMWQVPPIIVIYVNSVSSSKTKVLTVSFSGDTVIDWNYTVSAAGGGFQAGNVSGGTIGN